MKKRVKDEVAARRGRVRSGLSRDARNAPEVLAFASVIAVNKKGVVIKRAVD
jgi:hypothetical protein